MKRQLRILAIVAVLVTVVSSMAFSAAKSNVTGVRWASRDGGLRVVVDMTSPVKYGIERSGKKVTLSLSGASLSMKARGGKLASPGKTWQIKAVGKGAQLVIDTGTTMGLKHFTMRKPDRIILDLKPVPSPAEKVTPVPAKKDGGKTVAPPKKVVPKKVEPETQPALPQLVTQKVRLPLKRGRLTKGIDDRIEIPLFEKDLAVNSVFNTQISYFQVSPSWRIRDCAVDLTVSHSQMTDRRFSNLTVEVNGLPVKTVPLDGKNLWKGQARLKVPADYLEPGVNFITLRSFMRANDIPCRDIDNPGNWLRVHRDSRIVIDYGLKADFILADFPEPFFEPDSDRRAPCIFVIPDDAVAPEVEAALKVLSDWADNYALRDFRPRLVRVSELMGDDAAASHLIFLGRRKAFGPAVLEPFGVDGVDWEGHVFLSSFFDVNGKARLLVAAEEAQEVLFGVRSLLTPEVRIQMRKDRQALPLSTPLAGKVPAGELPEDLTLRDIYVDNIVFRGTASHAAPLSFYIPPQWEVTGDPSLILKFRHSPALRPDRSSLTVDFGEVPRKAVELGPENVEEGRLVVPIPEEYNGGDFLDITLRGYLDIGSADCNHNYSEAAWLVVDRDSAFHIPHTDRPLQPYLESLPYAFGKGPLDVYIDDGLDGPALTGLASLLTFWQADLSDTLSFSLHPFPEAEAEAAPEHHRLFFGHWKELERAGFESDVSLSPDGEKLVSGAMVPVLPEFAAGGAFFQLMERGKTLDLAVGWAGAGVHPGMFSRIRGKLAGEMALVSPEGATVAFYPRLGMPEEPDEELKPVETQLARAWEFLHGERRAAAILGFVSAVILLGLFVVLVRLIRRGY